MQTRTHLSKSQTQRIHARRRFLTRKNIRFTGDLAYQLVQMIVTGDPRVRLIEEQPRGMSVWEVPLGGISCRIVYDRSTRNIVTVLPERWNADYVQRWWEN